jgi:hypothetical protein
MRMVPVGKATHKVKVAHQVRPKLTADSIKLMARSVGSRKLALTKAMESAALGKTPEPPKGWSLIPASADVKQPSVSADVLKMFQEAYDNELKMARGAIQSAYGTKAVKFKLPTGDATITGSAVITTGLVTTVVSVLASDATEFSTLALLFDEYRIRRGSYHYFIAMPTQPINTASAVGSSVLADCMFAIAFDPADATALTTLNSAMQMAQHQVRGPRFQEANTGGGTLYVGAFGNQENTPFVFTWHYPDVAEITGSGGVVAPGYWKACQGNVSTFIEGSLKFHYRSGSAVAQSAVFGVGVYELEFRSRT